MRKRTAILVLTLLLALPSGCAQPSQPAVPDEATRGAQSPAEEDLYGEIRELDYESWATAPGHQSRQKARGPHGDEVQVRLSPEAEDALADGVDVWPVGAVIVKDVYRDGALEQIAAMKKTNEGWYWGEWDSRGEPIAEGLRIDLCEGCHRRGTDGTLAVSLE
jgi:hypothetical protein